jgi:uncharacterized protein
MEMAPCRQLFSAMENSERPDDRYSRWRSTTASGSSSYLLPMGNPDSSVEALANLMKDLPPFAVAFSGGLDSSLLCAVAAKAVGEGFIALTADTPFTIREDIARAVELAAKLGIRHEVILLDPLADQAIAANLPDRCYLCKKKILGTLASAADSKGINVLLDGTNADDMKEDRPGLRALREMGILSPLAELGIGRKAVIELSEALGLPDPRRPNNACLATRVPNRIPLRKQDLEQIEKAERAVRSLGYKLVRVRLSGSIARVVLGEDDLRIALDPSRESEILSALSGFGFRRVELDRTSYECERAMNQAPRIG